MLGQSRGATGYFLLVIEAAAVHRPELAADALGAFRGLRAGEARVRPTVERGADPAMPVMTCGQAQAKFTSRAGTHPSGVRRRASGASAAAVGRIRQGLTSSGTWYARRQRRCRIERHVARNGGSEASRRRSEVGGDREDEAIAARPVLGALERGRSGASVGIENDVFSSRERASRCERTRRDSGGRAAVSGVEHMRRELSHRAFPAPRRSGGAAQKCIVVGTR